MKLSEIDVNKLSTEQITKILYGEEKDIREGHLVDIEIKI